MGREQAEDDVERIKIEQLKAKGKKLSKKESDMIRQPVLDKYKEESSAYYSTARLWDDGIIDPVDTRNVLALGISMSLNAPIPEHKFGVFRM